jgi:hypothetical protein
VDSGIKPLDQAKVKEIIRDAKTPISGIVQLYEHCLGIDLDNYKTEGFPAVSKATDEFIVRTAHFRFRQANHKKWDWCWFNYGFTVIEMDDWMVDTSNVSLIPKEK